MLSKNEVYIIRQPVKSVMSVVLVDSFGFSEKCHESLDMLGKESDLFFIFYNSKTIDCRKFTSLYRGFGFIESDRDYIGHSLFKSIQYSKEIYPNTHFGFSISEANRELDRSTIENLKKVNIGGIVKPILKIDRLGGNVLRNLYTKRLVTEDSWWKKLINRGREFYEQDNDELIYCTHTSQSNIVYLSLQVVKEMIDKRTIIPNYISSFSIETNPMPLIASYIKFLKIDNIDNNLGELNINNLKGNGKV